MIKLILTTMLMISPSYKPVKRIEQAILTLQPEGNPDVARQLARSLWFHCRAFKLDPMVAVALGFVESSLQPGKESPTHDIGIFQINERTARRYGLDIKRLKADIDYMVYAYALVVSDKLRICNNDLGCYNSINEPYRTRYRDRVHKQLNRLKVCH